MMAKNSSRILTPSEWEILYTNLNPYYQIVCEAALFSGLRPTELRRYAEHPRWRVGSYIYLPSIPNHQIPRAVPLSNEGRYAMEVFDLTVKSCGYRERSNIHQALGRAVVKADDGFDGKGINESMFRETWLAWLSACHPKQFDKIRLSMAAEPCAYMHLTFPGEDIPKMVKYTYGW